MTHDLGHLPDVISLLEQTHPKTVPGGILELDRCHLCRFTRLSESISQVVVRVPSAPLVDELIGDQNPDRYWLALSIIPSLLRLKAGSFGFG